MTAVTFLIEELKELQKLFPSAEFRYEMSHGTNTHLVEITPDSIYNNNDYIDYELALEEEFISLFPTENIIFISEDSLNKITNPIFEIYSEEEGSFIMDFDVLEELESFIFAENEFQFGGENNYALAA